MSDKKTIVIIGGGSAGAAIARALSKALSPETHRIIVINPRPYLILLPASLRMVVSNVDNLDDPEKGALVPYDKLFLNDNGTVIQAAVTEVIQKPGEKNGSVILNTGEEIEYDALVLASGARWGGPIDFPEGDKTVLFDYIAERREEFARAKDVLIVGGGSVAIGMHSWVSSKWT